MFRVSVSYGLPTDPAAFDRYYEANHIPLVRKVPGLVGFTTGKPNSLVPGQEAPYYMVANLFFASAEEFQSALHSAEMAATNEDVANFASGGVTIFSAEETPHL